MGNYFNPGNESFKKCVNSPIYVDKSKLIEFTNSVLDTNLRFMCVSRPRRFGKTMAADMLAAYYSRGCSSDQLFEGLAVSATHGYKENLNNYNVLKINMQRFLSASPDVGQMLGKMSKYLLAEFKKSLDGIAFIDETDFVQVMMDVYEYTGHPFVILIDEWDCLFREYQDDKDSQRRYLDFLRMWLKDQDYVALAYMTGILPIKKYGTHSALNMFAEYSMTDSGPLAGYYGFTEGEVRALCNEYGMNFDEAKAWYDGYTLSGDAVNGAAISIYSPKSVSESMFFHRFGPYWNNTETYEALKVYIQMNYDGLKDDVIRMLAGGSAHVDTSTFSNDMTTFSGKDDVLTLLIHLGYLSYNAFEKSVSIPNKEVSQEYVTAISTMGWPEVIRSVNDSQKLLEALWNQDADALAAGIDRAHNEISVFKYNDENSLSCTVHLAFYFAREYYNIVRELPTGKGFADICFIPRPMHADKPAAVIELKWDKDARGAVAQIKERNYVDSLRDYHGNLLLAGINYDKVTKSHSCVIEKLEK